MTRLIDADKLHPDCLTKDGTLAISQSQIANAPTVSEDYDTGYQDGLEDGLNDIRPQGKWIYHEDWKNEGGCGYECSCCGRTYDYDMNFCGYCGADMKGEEDGK